MTPTDPSAPEAQTPVILFDASCVLCSANAQFVLRHDKAGRFRLAAMQGETGGALYRRHGMDPADPVSMLLVARERMRKDSDAVLAIYEGLGWPWRAAAIFRLVPAMLRDPVYRWIARNRYRIFGRRKTCWVAPVEYRARILP